MVCAGKVLYRGSECLENDGGYRPFTISVVNANANENENANANANVNANEVEKLLTFLHK